MGEEVEYVDLACSGVECWYLEVHMEILYMITIHGFGHSN